MVYNKNTKKEGTRIIINKKYTKKQIYFFNKLPYEYKLKPTS